MGERDVRTHTNKMIRLFNAADADGDGAIGIDEFRRVMSDADVLTWLSSMQVPVHDPDALFFMLDENQDGNLTCDELVKGAMRLKGGARSLDVIAMKSELLEMKQAMGHRFSADGLPKGRPTSSISPEDEPSKPMPYYSA